MTPSLGRVAFQRCLVHEHLNPASAISAIALDATGSRLYLGFTDGQLEEHRVVADFAHAKTVLSARKHVGKRPIAAIRHLPGAQCLAVLCDSVLLLLHVETLDGSRAPGLLGITAMSAEGAPATQPPVLALATKPSKKTVRITTLEVFASNSGQGLKHTTMVQKQIDLPELGSVAALAWVGPKLIVATGMRYLLLDPATNVFGTVCEFSEDDLTPVMLQPLPSTQQAVLLMNEVGVVTDTRGMPVGSALTFPSPPLALAQAGLFVLAVCSDGVHVFERTTGDWVQRLDFGESLQPAPGQAVRTAGAAKANLVAMAGYRKVWLLLPVALEDQAKQLLQRRKYAEALELLSTCRAAVCGPGPPSAALGTAAHWTLVGQAQAALLLMQDLYFAEGLRELSRIPVAVFQPKELLPLFPHLTARWLRGASGGSVGSEAAPASPHRGAVLLWGLARPLHDLTTAIHGSLLAQSRSHQGAEGINASALAAQVEQRSHTATAAVADYLWSLRHDPMLEQPDGVHTLLLLLLQLLEERARVLAFAGERNHVVVDEGLKRVLLQGGGYMAWAALCVQRPGRGAEALETWRALAGGEAQEAGVEAGAQHAALQATCASNAAAALTSSVLAPSEEHDAALTHLPWLLEVAPQCAVQVATGLPGLAPEEVLCLTRGRFPLPQLLLLQHVVTQQGSVDPSLHTELALTAIDLATTATAAALASAALTHDTLRASLQQHLDSSGLYDVRRVLEAVRGGALAMEQVILYRKLGEHAAALRILALQLGDLEAAARYCRQHAGQEGYAALMDMLLAPGVGEAPRLEQACQLLTARDANLDPLRVLRVLRALGDSTPLSMALPPVACMLRERTHRKRAGLIVRNLSKTLNLEVAAHRAERRSERVLLTDEQVCHTCQARIGTKMFAVHPSGKLVCFRCHQQRHG